MDAKVIEPTVVKIVSGCW